MIAACARVGANAPKGGEAGSLAADKGGGVADVVKKSSKACESGACLAGFWR
jgi:hypothetical protein